MFVLVFYALSPVPTLVARRFADSVEMSSVLIEICVFITSCIVISAYGLPLVLARAAEVVRKTLSTTSTNCVTTVNQAQLT